MKNKYVVRSRISEAKFRQIIKYFALDLQANQIAELTGISRNSINSYIKAIRVAIAQQADPHYSSYRFNNNFLFFGLTKQNQHIHIHYIPIDESFKIASIIKNRNSEIQSIDDAIPYHGLIDFSHKKHYGIKKNVLNKSEFDTSYFWGYITMRLMRFRGISNQTVMLHLRECEYRFNNRNENLYKLMLKLFRKEPLSF